MPRLRAAVFLVVISALMLLMTACGPGGYSSADAQKAQLQVTALRVDSQRWLGHWPAVDMSAVRESACADSGPGYIQLDLGEQAASGHVLNDLPARLRADGWSVQGTVSQLRASKHMAEGFEATLGTGRGPSGAVTVSVSIPEQLCGS